MLQNKHKNPLNLFLFLLFVSPLNCVFGETFKNTPLDIQADSLEIEQDKGYAVFEGDVIAKHGTIDMGAKRLEIYYAAKGNNQNSNIAGAIKQIVAHENVTISFGDDTAKGNKATYDPIVGKINLTGEVTLIRGKNVLTGESLSYDLATRKMMLKNKQADGRVKARFVPSDFGEK